MPAIKAEGAFRTIGEVSGETGIAQHILRYWETRFPQLRPVTRAGNRRYYRPDDVDLVQRIDRLLNREGYTVRGVQQLLARGDGVDDLHAAPERKVQAAADDGASPTAPLISIRDGLVRALHADEAAA